MCSANYESLGKKKIKMAEEAVPESEDQASPRKIAN